MGDLDLVADLNAQDDDGLGWSTLANAIALDDVRPGAILLAGKQPGTSWGPAGRRR